MVPESAAQPEEAEPVARVAVIFPEVGESPEVAEAVGETVTYPLVLVRILCSPLPQLTDCEPRSFGSLGRR